MQTLTPRTDHGATQLIQRAVLDEVTRSCPQIASASADALLVDLRHLGTAVTSSSELPSLMTAGPWGQAVAVVLLAISHYATSGEEDARAHGLALASCLGASVHQMVHAAFNAVRGNGLHFL